MCLKIAFVLGQLFTEAYIDRFGIIALLKVLAELHRFSLDRLILTLVLYSI